MAVRDHDHLVEGYARALFSLAEAEDGLGEVEDELFRFGKAVEFAPRLREALTDPALPADRKKAVIDELLGGKARPLTVRLLGFIIEQGRARDLPRIMEALARLAAERRSRVLAEVRSAIPLDGGQRERLARGLSRASGKDVELKVLIDPTVMGGLVARVGDQVFDGSVRRRLELARDQLAQVR